VVSGEYKIQGVGLFRCVIVVAGVGGRGVLLYGTVSFFASLMTWLGEVICKST